MKITLYVRTYPVAGAPVYLSLVPFPTKQKHTFTSVGKVYEAVYRELQVTVPDDAVVRPDTKLLSWIGERRGRWVNSTATEVYDLAKANASGFRTVS